MRSILCLSILAFGIFFAGELEHDDLPEEVHVAALSSRPTIG